MTINHKVTEPFFSSFNNNWLIKAVIKDSSNKLQKITIGNNSKPSDPLDNKSMAASKKRWLPIKLFKIASIHPFSLAHNISKRGLK